MKPTTLLSSLFVLALTSVVSAEEPGRPPEGGRPPERREDGERDKPRERGPETEVRKAEPARDGEAGRHAPGRAAEGSPKREGEKKPDGMPDKGRSEGHKGKVGDMHKGRGDTPHSEGKEGMQGRHEGPGHPGGPQVNHVMEAIKHLHAAGMHEVASLLEAKAKMPGHLGGLGRPSKGMRHPHMMKPPFAQKGRWGPGHEGREKHRGPRPEGEKTSRGERQRG